MKAAFKRNLCAKPEEGMKRGEKSLSERKKDYYTALLKCMKFFSSVAFHNTNFVMQMDINNLSCLLPLMMNLQENITSFVSTHPLTHPYRSYTIL